MDAPPKQDGRRRNEREVGDRGRQRDAERDRRAREGRGQQHPGDEQNRLEGLEQERRSRVLQRIENPLQNEDHAEGHQPDQVGDDDRGHSVCRDQVLGVGRVGVV